MNRQALRILVPAKPPRNGHAAALRRIGGGGAHGRSAKATRRAAKMDLQGRRAAADW